MKDNQLQVNASGVWLKTSDENLETWRALLKETLENHGYKQLAHTPSKDSYYLSWKHHHDQSYDSCESLFVNIFKNGHLRIETNLIESLFESIIPQFETKLNVKFEWTKGWEKYTYSPHVLHFLNGRDEFLHHHNPWWYKHRQEMREEIKKRDEVDEEKHVKIQGDLEETRRHLTCAKEELECVSSTHAQMQEEITAAKQKIHIAKEELKSVNETHEQMEGELDCTNKKLTSAKEELTSVTEALSQMSVDVGSFNDSRKEALQCVHDRHLMSYPGSYHPGYHHPGYHHPGYPLVPGPLNPRYSREFSWVPDGKGGWQRRAFWEC